MDSDTTDSLSSPVSDGAAAGLEAMLALSKKVREQKLHYKHTWTC